MKRLNINSGYLQIAMETLITFSVLLILTRILGKKQLSHLTFFNYVTGITVGSIAANMVILETGSYIKELTSLVTWCALTILVEYISLKSSKLRIILDGEPTILIKKGVINKKALSSKRINIDDLTMMIRQQSAFSINEIEYAILEPNGALSVLKKPQCQNAQKIDVQANPPSPAFIPTEIITDGKLINRNLKEVGINRKWLDNQLKNAGIKSVEEVFYAEIQTDGKLFIQKI